MDTITLNLDGFDIEFGIDTELYEQNILDETDDWANVHVLITSNLLNLTMNYEINSDIFTFREIEELTEWFDNLEDPDTDNLISFIYPELEFSASRVFASSDSLQYIPTYNNLTLQNRLKVDMHFNFYYPSENSWPDHYLSLPLYENDITKLNDYLKNVLYEYYQSKKSNM